MTTTGDRIDAWERDFLGPRLPARTLTYAETRALVVDACRFLRIPAPGIVFAASAVPCKAVPALAQVRIGDSGRTPVAVLREVARLASWPAVRGGETEDGPTFLDRLARLYSRFLDLDPGFLRESAARSGLDLDVPDERKTS